ncbi:MAG: TadE/TadG family type IV pilus assembly protein [Desulfobaccales bacterium]
MGRKDQSQRGTAAVEFALLAPLFVAVLFAIVEFGLVIYTKSMLAQATREGARYGVVYATPRRTQGEIQAVVQNFLNQCGLTSDAAVAITGAGGASGTALSVGVTYSYQFFVLPRDMNRFLGGRLPSSISLNTTTRMILE